MDLPEVKGLGSSQLLELEKTVKQWMQDTYH